MPEESQGQDPTPGQDANSPPNPPRPRQGTAEQSHAIGQTRPSLRERIAEWIAAYEHGLQHNSPRTQGELDRLKDILGWSPPTQPAAGEERQ